MDFPFYRSYYPVRELPVRYETTPARKVIQIPVGDGLGRERSRVDSAVMIQKVLRGFLVRKSMKKIAEVRSEVNEIEKKILSMETVELIRRYSRERLKINEELMRLLLRLDSVRSVDSGVRDCRKAVIKKAIRLQEIVDSISDITANEAGTVANSASSSNSPDLRNIVKSIADVDQKLESEEKDECVAVSSLNSLSDVDQKLELQNKSDSDVNFNSNSIKLQDNQESQNNGESMTDASEAREIPEEEIGENQGNVELNVEEDGNECAESVELNKDESPTGSSENPVEDEQHGDARERHEKGGEIQENEAGDGGNEEKGKSIKLVEKLIEDNEKMMGLMADLLKKNAMQTELLSSLSQRVEHLERAFMCEKSRKKTKRKKKNSFRNLEKDKFN